MPTAARRREFWSTVALAVLGIVGLWHGMSLINVSGEFVAKPNYHHARKQRELARKARQQEKQHRRTARQDSQATHEPGPAADPAVQPAPSSDPT